MVAGRTRTAASLLYVGVFGAGIYGGYFGAAQGVLLIALLGLLLDEHLQRINAAKNVLAGLVNRVAAVDLHRGARRRLGGRGADRGRVGHRRPARCRIGRRVAPAGCCAALVVVVGVVAIVQIVAS